MQPASAFTGFFRRYGPTILASILLIRCVVGEATPGETIGIDLGTTYSCVGYLNSAGNVDIIPNLEGSRTTPSWVAIPSEGNAIYVGQAAKQHGLHDPANTFFDPKRLIGRSWKEVSENLKSSDGRQKYPFRVVEKAGKPVFEAVIDGAVKHYTPEEISAKILIYLKETAEAYLGKPVSKAVITVPAYFNDSQRQATKDAGQIAKLEVVRLLNEPTAAAIAYGLDKVGSSKICVFDLGGGTFDVSLLQLEDGVFEVKSVNGNNYLGGQDFDEVLIDWAAKIAKTPKYGSVDILGNDKLKNAFRRTAEKAKIALSTMTKVPFEVDGLPGGKTFSEPLMRSTFEQLAQPLFRKTMEPVANALKDAKWAKKDVDHIVLVGGSTRIPRVQEMLREFFDGKELDRSVHPDEAVAYGAALQAGILSGAKRTADILVVDATPLSLGIETQHGVMTVLIERNTSIPTKKTQTFSTASDNQDRVDVKVYEGERSFARDNRLLGNFTLSGIPPAPRGIPKIDVTFELDVNSILTVSAKDLGSGSHQTIRISNDKGRLSKADIERMIQEAEAHQDEDRKRREQIDAQDSFDRYLHQLRDQIEDKQGLGGRLSDSERTTIAAALDEGTSWFAANRDTASKEEIQERQSAVEKTVGPIIASLYNAGGPGAADDASSQQQSHDVHDDL